jgi:hypothetical protein
MLLKQEIHPQITFWLNVVADKVMKFIALVVGALWTYFLYRRSHPDESRPEVEAEGSLFKQELKTYLSIRCTMKNVGQSEYWIERQGTVCEVGFLPGDDCVPPIPYRAQDVFGAHIQMEAGATIRESLMVPVPFHQELEKLRGVEIRLRVRVSGKVKFLRRLLRKRLVKVFLTNSEKIFRKDFEEPFRRVLVNVLLIYLESVFRKPLRGVSRELLESLKNQQDSVTIFMAVFRQVFSKDFGKVASKYLEKGLPCISDEAAFKMIFLDVLLNHLRKLKRNFEVMPIEDLMGQSLEMMFANIFKYVDKESQKDLEEEAFGDDLERVIKMSFDKVFGERLQKVSGSNFDKVFSDDFEKIFGLGFEKVKVLGSIRWKIFGRFFIRACGKVTYTVYPTNFIIRLSEGSIAKASPMLGSFAREESNV